MDENQHTTDRRRFSRVLFDAEASLLTNGVTHVTRLIDISLKGALVEHPEGWNAKPGDPVTLTVALAESGESIRMKAQAAHMEANHMGLKCLEIDMDSISHLRRLVELNLGDGDLLERELEALG